MPKNYYRNKSQKRVLESINQSDKPFEQTYNRILNYLSFRQRTGKEVYEKAVMLCGSEEIAELIVERLTESNLINDKVFAQSYIEQGLGSQKPFGLNMLVHKLGILGVSNVEITQRHYELEEEAAVRLSKRYMKSMDLAGILKLKKYLLSRGFTGGSIKRVVDSFSKVK